MSFTVYFRESVASKEEVKACLKAGFKTSFSMLIPNQTVIARYSVLPFYKDIEKDLISQKSCLLNTFREHLYIANMDYYHDIEDLTFKSYFALDQIPNKGSFVVKGLTNSRKHDWNTLMFAEDRKAAIEIASVLMKDSLIGSQNIVVREYNKLKTYEIGLNGLPVTNEWRFFFYQDKIIDFGYYWSNSEQCGQFSEKAKELALKAANILKNNVNFFVVDVAEKENGEWIVVEVNDGQMSGLSNIDPERFYQNLKKVLGE